MIEGLLTPANPSVLSTHAMADEEELPEPPAAYSLTTESGQTKTSIDYTGKGTAAYTNGDVYEGLFEAGQRQGEGVYKYRHGDVYEGNFENNVKAGEGKLTYKKGGCYEGNFKDGKRHGKGTFEYANGDQYVGMWLAGKRHGDGTYTFNKTNYTFNGEWKDGQIVWGIWSMTDGTKYTGNFQSQKPSGEGVWETVRGTVVEGAYLQQIL